MDLFDVESEALLDTICDELLATFLSTLPVKAGEIEEVEEEEIAYNSLLIEKAEREYKELKKISEDILKDDADEESEVSAVLEQGGDGEEEAESPVCRVGDTEEPNELLGATITKIDDR